ncbi:unnamed protein product [Lactuca saligna]|uniref:Uncharacterized protein n=2 Tax=Lactuca TaxID=4235 RepID=A0AA35V1R6_LACSI|nr:unnamed protein product [Lactuca saligna]
MRLRLPKDLVLCSMLLNKMDRVGYNGKNRLTEKGGRKGEGFPIIPLPYQRKKSATPSFLLLLQRQFFSPATTNRRRPSTHLFQFLKSPSPSHQVRFFLFPLLIRLVLNFKEGDKDSIRGEDDGNDSEFSNYSDDNPQHQRKPSSLNPLWPQSYREFEILPNQRSDHLSLSPNLSLSSSLIQFPKWSSNPTIFLKTTIAEAAEKIDVDNLASFLLEVTTLIEAQQDIQLMRFADYFGRAFSSVTASQFPWVKLLRESPVAKVANLFGCAYLGPFGHFYHLLLDKLFKGKKDTTTVAKKVLLEQVTSSPWNNLIFMLYYGLVIEGRSWIQVKSKIKKEYPTVQYAAAMALPPLSIRGDLGVVSTAGVRYAYPLLKSFAKMGPQGVLGATKLLRPFSEIVDSLGLKDPFIRNWVDLLSFLLAGVKSDGVLSAEMIYMFAEWYKPGCSLEYPVGGTGALVEALVLRFSF